MLTVGSEIITEGDLAITFVRASQHWRNFVHEASYFLQLTCFDAFVHTTISKHIVLDAFVFVVDIFV